MLIDWFTVAAQALNFIILLVLLKIFLYNRVVRAMDAREQAIQDRMRQAQEERHKAEQEQQALAQERDALARRKEELLNEAREEARQRREAILAEAREDAHALRQDHARALRREQQSLAAQFRERCTELALTVARRTLDAVAARELQNAAVERFLHTLKQADPKETARLAHGAVKDGRLVIATPFPLDEKQSKRAEKAARALLEKHLDDDAERPPILTTTDDALVLGAALRGGGRSLGFSVRDFLDDAERAIHETLADALDGTLDEDNATTRGAGAHAEGEERPTQAPTSDQHHPRDQQTREGQSP